jgi:hypothetical protein
MSKNIDASAILNQDRMTKAILYVVGTLEELKKNEYIKGGNVEISSKGSEGFKLLKESGFKPTKEEIDMAMYVIQNNGKI